MNPYELVLGKNEAEGVKMGDNTLFAMDPTLPLLQ